MVIAYDEEMVRRYMQEAVVFSQERPVLIDRFLEDATEVDVDALADQDGDGADRGHHGTHRGSGRAFRRQLLRSAAAGPFRAPCSRPFRITPSGWRARCT